MNRSFGFAVAALFALILIACASQTPAPTATPAPSGETQRGLALVQTIDVVPPTEGATQAEVVVRGILADSCTDVDNVEVARNNQVFVVTVHTVRQAQATCATIAKDFERTVTLDVAGLAAGDYVVVVNGVSGNLTLGGTAVAQATPEPTAAPTQSAPTAVPTTQPTTAPPTPATSGDAATDCIDKAAFYADVTVPDNTPFKQGEKFVKTWRVRNEGTCTWRGYALIFAGGEAMSAPPTSEIPTVAPGDITDISINLVAPSRGGNHTGNWQFQNARGSVFGVGVGSKGTLWVAISVNFSGQETIPSTGSPGSSTPPSVAGCNATRNSDYENQILAMINSARAANGLPPLTLQNQLSAAAWQHSQDMACGDFISHTGSDGSSFKNRVAAQGYANYNTARENIYVGDPNFGGSPQGAFDWWMNSQVHRDNILHAGVTEIGIAYAFNPNSSYKGHYTLVFARPWNP